ncbi:CACNA1S, partial [Symbiodinium microadriaticum]
HFAWGRDRLCLDPTGGGDSSMARASECRHRLHLRSRDHPQVDRLWLPWLLAGAAGLVEHFRFLHRSRLCVGDGHGSVGAAPRSEVENRARASTFV